MKGNSVRKQRAVKATDSEWDIVQARARAARMSASGYVVQCALAPEWPSGPSLATLSAQLDQDRNGGADAVRSGADQAGWRNSGRKRLRTDPAFPTGAEER